MQLVFFSWFFWKKRVGATSIFWNLSDWDKFLNKLLNLWKTNAVFPWHKITIKYFEFIFFLARHNIHGLHGHIFIHTCAQEKSQQQVSIKLESLWSRVWYVTDKLTLCAELNFSFQRFTTIIFLKICDLCKTCWLLIST